MDLLPTGMTKPVASSLIDAIPLPLVLLLASPYLAGATAGDAVKLAHRIYGKDCFASTIDVLGEDARNEEQCDHSVELFCRLLDTVKKLPLPCRMPREQITVSMKPSMFATVVPASVLPGRLDAAYERIKTVVKYAQKHGINMTLEAEDHLWTDFQLETYVCLVNEGLTNLGTVLQSRLFRTRNDIKRFDERMRVRLVIGIYNETAEIAHSQKWTMKELLVEYAGLLAERGTYIEIASHDIVCLDNFFRQVAIPQRLPASRFETQFLMGVPRRKLEISLRNGSYFHALAHHAEGGNLSYLEQLEQSGILVRLYLPFGGPDVAGPYCKRRLKANPNMVSYGIKNFLHIP